MYNEYRIRRINILSNNQDLIKMTNLLNNSLLIIKN